MPYSIPESFPEGPIRKLLEGLSTEIERHGRLLSRSSYWHTDHIYEWEWDWDSWAFSCKVPAGDSYRKLTVRIDLPAVGRPLRVHCNCRLPPSRGKIPFPHQERCEHTSAALRFLCSHLVPALGEEGRLVREKLSSDSVATWNSTLSILDGFLAEHDSAAPEIDRRRRLTWRVRLDRHGPELGAWEQKVRGPGWTEGQKVSCQRLVRDRALWTTEADAQVVTRIFEDRLRLGYRQPSWAIDIVAALRDLVGHPLVFRSDEPRQPVTIEAAELSLHLRAADDSAANDGDLVLEVAIGDLPLASCEPRGLCQDGGTLLAFVDGGTRILVTEVEPQILDLVARLGYGGRRIRAAEREEILARLSPLAAVLPLELAAEVAAPAPAADTAPRLFLQSREKGMAAAIRVRPAPGMVPFPPGEGPVRLTVLDDGRCGRIERRPGEEKSTARALADRLGLDAEGGWDWLLENDDAALDLVLAAQQEAVRGLKVEWPADDPRRIAACLRPSALRVEIASRRDYFAVRGGVEVGERVLSLAALLDGLYAGNRYVPLGGGDWVQLTAGLRARLVALSDAVRPRRSGLEVDLTAAPRLRELLDDARISWQVSARFRAALDRLEEAERLDPGMPAELSARLRPYQLDGYRWLCRLAAWGMGGCLADDMGLGKTVQALALLLDRRPSGPALVVAPLSVCSNWLREARRFAPAVRCLLYHGTDRARLLEDLGAGDLVVTSYGLLRRDVSQLADVSWGTLVLDEAQAIKNSRTATARAARRIEAGWRLALTGTPLENHLGELWSLFRTISPGLFGSWNNFRERFAEPIERYGNAERRQALSRCLQPFVLRRTKAEVLSQLPARTAVDLIVELSEGERRLYDAARLAALAQIKTTERRRRGAVLLAALTRLRQLACHPALVESSWTKSSAKLELAVDLIVELQASGHRALVFSQFTRLLTRLREALGPRGIDYQYLDGATPPDERQRRVDAFQTGADGAFLISLKAGGTGLNLTAADYVILLDPWWNPAVENQASDRVHRIGQTRPVTVYRLVTRGTIEDEVLKLQEEKRRLVSGVLEGTGRAGRMSTDELMRLVAQVP